MVKKNLSNNGITGKERAKCHKDTWSWACHLRPWSSYAWYPWPFMFQEQMNTPFCLKWLVLAFFPPKHLSLCKVGSTGSFSIPYAFLTLLLCCLPASLSWKLRSRVSYLALSYSPMKLITMPLSSKPAPPSAFFAPMTEFSILPETTAQTSESPTLHDTCSPAFPLLHIHLSWGSREESRFDQLPCFCLKDNLVKIMTGLLVKFQSSNDVVASSWLISKDSLHLFLSSELGRIWMLSLPSE